LRVLIDTTFARRGPSGTGVYLERLTAALRALGADVVEAANERRRPPAGGGIGSLRNLLADSWWTEVELPRRARAAGAAVVHHPLPAVFGESRGPAQVTTVHDLGFARVPECFDPRFRAFARRAHRAAARRARAVVCVSESTARDVRALWAVPTRKLVVAPHGAGQEPPPRPDPAAGRHLLYVGDDEPRKNLACLLRGYAGYRDSNDDPLPLVLAGTARARAAGVRVEPQPDRQALAELYAGALALVHPSLHEGFGLTALEAMHANVPVLAARSPGVVETCGEAARYFDPRDPAALAAAIAELAGDAQARRELAARGRRRAGEFSWERSARAHLDAYTLALDA
jgi:glycosyltransferase involved in cell wall biosynthesis